MIIPFGNNSLSPSSFSVQNSGTMTKETLSQRHECPSMTRQFIQGPWWASLYRRGLVQKSNIDKKEIYSPPTTRIASSVHLVSSHVGLFSWIRQPINWMRQYQDPSCHPFPETTEEEDDVMSPSSAYSSFSTSTISTHSSISTVEDELSEHDSGCELTSPSSLYGGEGGVATHFDKQLDFDPAPTRSWPPESQSSVITQVVQELSPQLADAWHKHEMAMKQYRQQYPIPPTQRRKYIKSSKRRYQQRRKSPMTASPRVTPSSLISSSSSSTTGGGATTTRSQQLVDLARSALVYFENAYGHIPDGMLPMLREAAA
ncbi:hypothetical protein O0I10_005093 [Lichtheimia ornata]|uniref:Uncharacterized protein n=1 Tax=Lichtheimia ornata TaxID=688661 RepID=A0AAD7V692_9FUNG|nr:uncharacterized protein O0I10_005093 [Lichtheimia ornata]KAJ8659055.1 hypothetical protein O0I10_005093 [Lichtheimia ornata]